MTVFIFFIVAQGLEQIRDKIEMTFDVESQNLIYEKAYELIEQSSENPKPTEQSSENPKPTGKKSRKRKNKQKKSKNK